MFLSQHFSFPCQYHSTIAPYSSIRLPPTLYNVSLPVLQFSPVSIIPPLLHTHSSIYHPHYIIFLSQYFSFPLSVSFHHCSILILSCTTDAVRFSKLIMPCNKILENPQLTAIISLHSSHRLVFQMEVNCVLF